LNTGRVGKEISLTEPGKLKNKERRERRMRKCQHKHIDRGLKFPTMRFYSFCRDCGKQWLDNGRKWEQNESILPNNHLSPDLIGRL